MIVCLRNLLLYQEDTFDANSSRYSYGCRTVDDS